MRTWLTLALVVLGTGFLAAQERIGPELALKIAKILGEQPVDGPQIKMDIDVARPFGMTKGEMGAMLIPDKKLTEEIIAKAGKEIQPVGQLWFRKIAPAVDGKVLSNDKLRILKVTVEDKDHHLPMFLLGVRNNKEGPELVVFGKGKEPVATLPLKKAESRQEFPLEMEAREENNAGLITLQILGKYQARLTVLEQEP